MAQEETSIFWEVIVLVILSKKVYMYMRPIANGFCVGAISRYRPHKGTSRSQDGQDCQDPLRRATRHILTRAAKCIDAF
jgi:hypothetical protein